MKRSYRFLGACALSALALAFAGKATAAQYPDRPVHLVVPYPAGGPVDVLARVLGQRLSDTLGQPFIVDDRPGASGTVGSEFVAKAAPDGYTLVMGNNATHATNESLYPSLRYATLRDFAPIGLAATVTNILVVAPNLPVQSVAELIAYAKARPGKLDYASTGSGSAAHLTAEMFKLRTGTDIVHVPYKGAAPAASDLLAGQVGLMFASAPTVFQYVKAGTLRALAVTGASRWASPPDVPTMAEAGVPGFTSEVWFGLFAPAGTPRDVVDRLNAGLVTAAAVPDIRAKLAEEGFDVMTDTPEEFRAFISAEITKWA
ncbi:MAG TPA: tripartite tricarboxylate transporter substrate binding protein, partial [Alphaproteobacteria bacterium]|nr:tripartite tricarboxylate transporter substrate binding protein [Alphaproteobacteria bacterium]